MASKVLKFAVVLKIKVRQNLWLSISTRAATEKQSQQIEAPLQQVRQLASV